MLLTIFSSPFLFSHGKQKFTEEEAYPHGQVFFSPVDE
jgi:hypothetical protein